MFLVLKTIEIMIIVPIKTTVFLKRKTGKKDVFTIFLRLSHQGQIVELSLKIDVAQTEWDFKKNTIKTSSSKCEQFNLLVDQTKRNVLNMQQEMLLKGRSIDIFYLKERLTRYNGTNNNLDPLFLEMFDLVIERKKAIGGDGNKVATLQKYKRCRAHLSAFIQGRYKRQDIRFDELKGGFLEDFEFYIRTRGECSHNTTMKYIQTLRSIFNHARARGITQLDPFLNFKISLKEVNREFLSEDELQLIIASSMSSKYLEVAKDMFLFACFTGLSYIDLKNLKGDQIVKENDTYWIRTRRQKTNVTSNIPLLEFAQRIILKHHSELGALPNQDKVIPLISNQKANKALKKIASTCGITKTLTFHIARHTFATSVTLSNGVPIESVSKMLGHKRIVTTQHYAKLIDQKVKDDMVKLQTALQGKY
jgi:site-specific recombinase XerD